MNLEDSAKTRTYFCDKESTVVGPTTVLHRVLFLVPGHRSEPLPYSPIQDFAQYMAFCRIFRTKNIDRMDDTEPL